jgi:hypothetical protein
MAEYFGYEVDEREDGDFLDLVMGVDPKFHPAIARALSDLCNWYGDKAYRKIDDWFTIIYGTILEVEEVLQCTRAHAPARLDLDFSAKDR